MTSRGQGQGELVDVKFAARAPRELEVRDEDAQLLYLTLALTILDMTGMSRALRRPSQKAARSGPMCSE